jgi:dihydroorotate dehydrogenase
MHKLVISAPFGNHLHFPFATPTLGTFTLRPRGGLLRRLWRVLATVRYYPSLGAWRNRLGLPNPGIDAFNPDYTLADKIVSVKGFDAAEWRLLAERVDRLAPLALEMNASCPNCPGEDRTDYALAFGRVEDVCRHTPVIVKLPPVGYEPLVRLALDAGIDSFHCCNTLPVPGGGLSGKPLQPLSLRCVADVRTLRWLVGGGGVTGVEDARRFLDAGATTVAVASTLFLPWRWRAVREMAYQLSKE